ncbi:MAG TPA: hypothetical protein VGH28_14240 [Polyangiaceae bacterium]|jgi:hypothetical protein
MGKKNDVFTMPLDALEKQVKEAAAAIEKVLFGLEGLAALTAEERLKSDKFRNGEAEALLGVLDAADANPKLFESLADKDFGNDPDEFETDVLRDRLQRIALLMPLAERLDGAKTLIDDTVLQLSAQTKPVLQQGYGIAKSVAKTNPKMRALIAKAIDYYARIARKGVETRKNKPKAS